MMLLGSPAEAAEWLRGRVHGRLRTDSRLVEPGDGFIAWPGSATDGRAYVAAAQQRGAVASLVERSGVERFDFDNADVGALESLKAATGPLAAIYYGQPSRKLRTVAFTGTNGKTSSAWWLAAALSRAEGYDLGPSILVGTLGLGYPTALTHTGLTTPDPVMLHERLRELVNDGARTCVLEASSIGIDEHRLNGLLIEVAGFTNFTQDHLDYHGSMGAYWGAKRRLFDRPELKAVVLNIDDAMGAELAERATRRGLDVWTVSRQVPARIRVVAEERSATGINIVVCEEGQQEQMAAPVFGGFNVSNLLGVVGALRALGVTLPDAVRLCSDLPAVPGRMEPVGAADVPLVLVDYAHTPDALEKALAALRPTAQKRGGRLWCVFGCGGNRDVAKRPLMGRAAEQGADAIVVTSDNPRFEDAAEIVAAIVAGVSDRRQVRTELDRSRAVRMAVLEAGERDVILIAGKGHELYQEVDGERVPFSDQREAAKALADRVASGRVTS